MPSDSRRNVGANPRALIELRRSISAGDSPCMQRSAKKTGYLDPRNGYRHDGPCSEVSAASMDWCEPPCEVATLGP